VACQARPEPTSDLGHAHPLGPRRKALIWAAAFVSAIDFVAAQNGGDACAVEYLG
jgi:hypothetical protein